MGKDKILGFWPTGESGLKKKVIKTENYKVFYEGSDDYHIDITSGYGAFALGYNNRELLDNINNNYNIGFLRGNINETCDEEEELAEIITSKGDWAGLCWAVSGSDAVEAAMAMADNYYRISEGTHRKKVVAFFPCFVGTTMWGKHVRGDYSYWNRIIQIQSPVWKTYDQQITAEKETLIKLKKILDDDVDKEIGSILMESSPWLDDMIPWSGNFWKEIRKICDAYNILWVLDDVAICWGKFGTWYGWQRFNVQPDISSIGKALTAGFSPLGVAVCNQKVKEILSQQSWDHGHTWQPNMWAVVSAIQTTKYIEKYSLLDQVGVNNQKIKEIAESLDCNYRGDYSMICLDLDKKITNQDLWNCGLTTGLPMQPTVARGQVKIVTSLIVDDIFFDLLYDRLNRLSKSLL